jgi:hypothetical protein
MTSPTARPLRPTIQTSRWLHASRAVEAADHLLAALKEPVGKPPSNAMQARRHDDVNDRIA